MQDSVYSQNCEDLQSAHYHVDRRCQRTSKMVFNKISYCLMRVPGKIHNCIITAWRVRGWISFSTSVSGVSSGVDKRQEFWQGNNGLVSKFWRRKWNFQFSDSFGMGTTEIKREQYEDVVNRVSRTTIEKQGNHSDKEEKPEACPQTFIANDEEF